MRSELLHEALSRSVIGGFYEVHNETGYGFLEPFYSKALAKELELRGHVVKREVAIALTYKGEVLGQQRMDMTVDDKLIIEIKATEKLHRDSHRQLISYLRASGLEVGLLLHFGPSGARFYRFVNSRTPGQSAKSAKSARL